MELHHRTPPTTAEVVTLIYLRILSVASRVSTARLERIALHRIDCVRLSVHYINRSRRSGWEHSIIDRDLGCRAIAQVQTTLIELKQNLAVLSKSTDLLSLPFEHLLQNC